MHEQHPRSASILELQLHRKLPSGEVLTVLLIGALSCVSILAAYITITTSWLAWIPFLMLHAFLLPVWLVLIICGELKPIWQRGVWNWFRAWYRLNYVGYSATCAIDPFGDLWFAIGEHGFAQMPPKHAQHSTVIVIPLGGWFARAQITSNWPIYSANANQWRATLLDFNIVERAARRAYTSLGSAQEVERRLDIVVRLRDPDRDRMAFDLKTALLLLERGLHRSNCRLSNMLVLPKEASDKAPEQVQAHEASDPMLLRQLREECKELASACNRLVDDAFGLLVWMKKDDALYGSIAGLRTYLAIIDRLVRRIPSNREGAKALRQLSGLRKDAEKQLELRTCARALVKKRFPKAVEMADAAALERARAAREDSKAVCAQ